MAVDDQVKVLEGEFKLIKSELRQTLVSVRDFLLDLKLPPMQEELSLLPTQIEQPLSNNQNGESLSDNQAPYNQSSANGDPKGTGNSPGQTDQIEDTQDIIPETVNPSEPISPEAESNDIPNSEIEDNGITSGDMPSDKSLNNKPELIEDLSRNNICEPLQETVSSRSQINLLANLIRWVSAAKGEIGIEQLPIFIDVYAIGGNLSQEIKEVILHLAEVATDSTQEKRDEDNNQFINEQISLCMEINSLSGSLPDELRKSFRRLTEILIKQTVQRNKADIWSKLLLELHGILSGNIASLNSLVTLEKNKDQNLEQAENIQEESLQKKDSGNEEKSEKSVPEKKAIKPAKLRLVLPGNDGNEQELDLGNLFIASEDTDELKSQTKLSTK